VSSAVVFLVGALVACTVGLVVLWLLHSVSQHRRRREIPFADQMRALSSNPSRARRRQPSGIVPVDPPDEET